jgi:pyruvate/2-oxoglutarate/acetoin dehydrogenase E1 component
MGEDIGAYGGAFKVTEGMLERFGELRVIDTPISEIGFTGAAAGAAHMGMRPVVEMQFIDFISCAYDMITNYIATSRYRGRAAADGDPRPVGRRGARRAVPLAEPGDGVLPHAGLKIVYPATAYDAKGLIKAAIRDDDPVLFFEHKWLYRRPQLREVLPRRTTPCRSARRASTARGRTSRSSPTPPWCTSRSRPRSAGGGGRPLGGGHRPAHPPPAGRGRDRREREEDEPLLVVHEDTRTGGIAGEIAMRVNEKAFEWLDAPILRVTALDAPVPYSPPLEDYFLPQVEDVVKAARYLAAY